ncbi:hypothetical protein KP509_30G071300 [Ceratopteris richardii]|uniref:SIS domain-containing protein n=1 Tax=Ceratopteris richardii TaxID=49495 RepID=A0A8T2R4R8_CERRI|nr:hypothetical protein KP509_30G071300 [Ceratopteris richardii]
MDDGQMVSSILKELGGVLRHSGEAAKVLTQEVADAAKRGSQVMLFGVGREGLMMKGFAMRLFHLGLRVSCIFDMTTPPISSNDLLVLSAGPGSFSTVEALASIARSANARVLLLTAQPSGPASRLADVVAHVPAQTMASDTSPSPSSLLPMGSLYEGALFILFEIVVLKLKDALGVSSESMRARHTNLE